MDITDPKILKIKGILFLLLGMMSGGIILCLLPDWRILLMLAICVWAFCRFYYFAFYVLHHYADPAFKYSGLLDLLAYLMKKKR